MRYMRRLVGILAVLILWEISARWKASPLFPPISKVFPALVELVVSGELWRHINSSMQSILTGYTIAVLLGLSLGIMITRFRSIHSMVMPVVDMMRPIAALTLFPLIILVLGLGIRSKSFVILWTAWPAILLNTMYGLENVNVEVQEASMLDGADYPRKLWYILIPLGLPVIMTGLRIGLSGGWISLVSAEMLGASSGLGYSILAYSQTFKFAEMYSIIIVIAMIGLFMNLILKWIQDKTDYKQKGEKNAKSKFIRFGDRASSFVVDSIGMRSNDPVHTGDDNRS